MSPMPSHDNVRTIGDIQVAYKFNLQIVKFPKKGSFTTNSNDLNLRCESMQIPEKNIENIKITLHGHDANYSGKGTFQDELELVFVETIDNKVKKFFQTWRELCHKTITGVGTLKTDSEAIFLLQQLGTTNNPIWEYKLTGCLYRGGTIGTADGASNEAVKPNLKIGYDYFVDKAL